MRNTFDRAKTDQSGSGVTIPSVAQGVRMGRRRLRSSLIWTIPLAAVMLLASACSPSAVTTKPSPTSASPEATVLGPFARGTVATIGSTQYELLGVVVGGEDWVEMSARDSLEAPPGKVASDGKRYVDVTIGMRDQGAPLDPNAMLPHGAPYVVADGKRFEAGGGADERIGSEMPTQRLVTEFELPAGARSAVVYLPASEDATQAVSFRLW